MGDKLLVTWSSEGANVDETDYAARLNSRDIKSVFFDKQTMAFSDIQFVTKTTEADIPQTIMLQRHIIQARTAKNHL